MKEHIHQGYGNIFEEMETQSANIGPARLGPSLGDSIYFPPSYFSTGKRLSFQAVLVSLSACLIVTTIGLYFYRYQPAAPQFQEEVSLPVIKESATDSKTEALESELSLMKKILVGLVESVESLSKESRQSQKEATDLDRDLFPYPVKVTVERAHLRNEPSRGGKSLGAVPKDTVLLATQTQEGWIRVSTPKGEDAWISSDIVSEKGN